MVKDLLMKHKLMFYERQEYITIQCLNPEHEDKNPSMSIHSKTGMFRCFSCHIRGSFQTLQRLLGEDPEIEPSNALTYKIEQLRRKLLSGSITADEPVQFPSAYTLHPGPWRGISHSVLKEFKVFISNSEDFHGRVWIPITFRNKLIGFQGRADIPNLEPKYLFYPRHIQIKPIIFGLDSIPKKTVVLTEGITDMLRLRALGVKEACCIFGSYLGIEKVSSLLTNDIEVVITMFDPDGAGKKATQQTQTLLRKHAPHIVFDPIWLEGTKDPADLEESQLVQILRPYEKYLL